MSISIISTLVSPLLFAVASLADKVLVKDDGEDSEPLVILALGGIFSLVFALPFGLWVYLSGQSLGSLVGFCGLFVNEILYIACMYLYLKAMKREEASRVVPWFQIIPIFGLLGAFFVLKEIPTWYQFVSVVVLMVGGFIVSFKDGKVDMKTVALVIFGSALLAMYDVVFAHFGRSLHWSSAIFINLVAKAFWCFMILVDKRKWHGFRLGLKTKLSVLSISESVCVVADISLCLFFLYLPVAFVQATCCFQPFFTLIGTVLLTKWFPEILREEVSGTALWQKVIGTALMMVGGIVLSLTMK